MHSICAILNKHQHGELYFGVKPDGTVVGQVVTEESLREVSQKIKRKNYPALWIASVQQQNPLKNILMI